MPHLNAVDLAIHAPDKDSAGEGAPARVQRPAARRIKGWARKKEAF